MGINMVVNGMWMIVCVGLTAELHHSSRAAPTFVYNKLLDVVAPRLNGLHAGHKLDSNVHACDECWKQEIEHATRE